MNRPYKRDWQKTRIHAVCGAIIGGGSVLVGGGDWRTALAGAIILAVLAGIFLDQFWEHFISWWH
jgi:ABC-type xylose transport system permease subunit